ncbi:sialate O-acetylesterase [Horticoccus sp. 23ND18S-11]|uniref:sialate O-acetylesterase n=1 Tax=Horticoccus sp. 23ND18S-11 TaxID=3391832 RepID=UPI0039C99E3E
MKHRCSRRLVLALASGALFPLARADVTLPAIFSDHLVLQRDVPVPVWGWADAGETVTVSVAGQTQTATTGADGKWRVTLTKLASGEPGTLVVKGKNTITINDVLIGEVWLGSGQSNMAMTVLRSNDAEREQAAANFPRIRMFKEESPAANTAQYVGKGQWHVCSPTTVGAYSAALYFFGREVHQTLGVPVGLINSSVGGTPIESWIAPEAQRASAELTPAFTAAEKENAEIASAAAMKKYESDLAAWEAAQKKTRTPKQKAAKRPQNPAEVQARKGNVGGLFNGKISPLIPYAIRGALWYQGEANSMPAKAPFYEAQLRLLVTDWRARWGYEFPFAWAQLPNFGGPGRDWPTVREAMLKTLALPQTGMGINIDIGDEKDIHPKNKQEVGRRLSLWALGTVYGQKVAATSGPLPAGHEVRGREIVLRFTHTNGGLAAKGGALQGFVVAGNDRQWKPAVARIDGERVVVSSPEVSAPVAARYAWENFPTCNLYNGAGLPATPFRTDTW